MIAPKLSFLVVDDSRLHHQIYNLVLSGPPFLGSHILHAMDGHEGYSLLVTHPNLSVVLLDLKMPVMNGLEFLRRRRHEKMHPNVPVVIVSTEGQNEDRDKALALGAADFLHKPFLPQDLYRVLTNLFGNQ